MPVSDAFDDIYYSNEDGLAESTYVFLQQNNLASRFQHWQTDTPFIIAETGFGTGLNFLLAMQLFLQQAPSQARLHFVSFERFPLTRDDLQKALSQWPQLAEYCGQLIAQYPPLVSGCHRMSLEGQRVTLDLHFGDVLDSLPDWQQAHKDSVNAWFLDGFAPAKNPQMWQPELYQAMARSAAADCTLATFTAVGAVRRGLQDSGFTVRKVKGFGSKRDMLAGHKLAPAAPRHRKKQRIAIVGAGIAGACLAHRLSRENTELHVFCADSQPAMAASGNAQGAVYPLLHADFTTSSALYAQAFVYASQYYQQHNAANFHTSGVLQLAFNPAQLERQQKIISRKHYPEQLVCAVDAEHASQYAGISLTQQGLYYPVGGWLQPAQVVRQLLQKSAARLHLNAKVTDIQQTKQGWQLTTATETLQVDQLVLANGHELAKLDKQLNSATSGLLDVRPVRGQITRVASNNALSALKTVVCHKGYVTPAQNGTHCIGASFAKEQVEQPARSQDDKENLRLLTEYVPSAQADSLEILDQRASIRATTADHLPLVGAMPRFLAGKDAGRQITHWQGLWVLGGLGSRGFTSAPWCAELLSAQIMQHTKPSGHDLEQALQPDRFARRKLVRGQL
ncbi:bifunctional tRNA (5-methylaminomethyl-2-thiouridine)(34)-methyltransferase MnmD/FAD-dependent 5-carboxymethylaminomethyl-2-thiouridine(34) oxidoreductase MnmC [Aliidiomarina minuta]|uniref:tRNA 5-methylaminomethyl-2-thiouridine biosynthesis bifunctional protein MnmC n=2 Tax=Aliidiomarina minuta TaxID=880057 RepID=A0A432W561_9GAMM|nr:bifunctional tRNA (5-methylaminomethyl-2-thiouridine)(34)-methyltransferase MnmD/FAD-dependent 5-carboxymethylaminomethyl-2-thiouridine(34) oxidoreductase MnmC [Aliidiomarina minuta]